MICKAISTKLTDFKRCLSGILRRKRTMCLIKPLMSERDISAWTASSITITNVVVILFEVCIELDTYSALNTSTLKIMICGRRSYLVPKVPLIRFSLGFS